tara:strand:- start:114 stop:476 length:363 start_codon:yes stop_codon:yes gene_type:complete
MKNYKKTFCFDLDNTICKTSKNNYKSSKPIKKSILIINNLYDSGHKIKIYTARYMGRTNDDIFKSRKKVYKLTVGQLKRWKVKYHKLFISKPSADLYIDDKSWGYNSNWKTKLKKYVNEK